jgi:hypothetical protein
MKTIKIIALGATTAVATILYIAMSLILAIYAGLNMIVTTILVYPAEFLCAVMVDCDVAIMKLRGIEFNEEEFRAAFKTDETEQD